MSSNGYYQSAVGSGGYLYVSTNFFAGSFIKLTNKNSINRKHYIKNHLDDN
jgi:hypothetical protein